MEIYYTIWIFRIYNWSNEFGIFVKKVAKQLAMMGFKVKGWSKTQNKYKYVQFFWENQLSEFLEDVKLLIVLLSSTTKTKGILNLKLFEKLNRGSFLNNLSWGSLLIE
jgi:glyoxylate/hydroxypyruvate reductase A